MALNIENPIAERLAHDLARATGESLTDAVIVALRIRLAAVKGRQEPEWLLAEVAELQAFVRSQPDRDAHTAKDILGCDQFGLPD